MEKLTWIQARWHNYFKEIHCIIQNRQTALGSENMLSWKQAGTRTVLGHHRSLFYSFPKVLLRLHIQHHFYDYFRFPWNFQILLSTTADCPQEQDSRLHKISSVTPEDLLPTEKVRITGLPEAEEYLLRSR